jgi:hypothetical protein
MPINKASSLLEFNHLEIFFTGATVRAEPVIRHIFPTRARCNAFFRATFFFFINPAADNAHPDFEFFTAFFLIAHFLKPEILRARSLPRLRLRWNR